MARAPLPHPWRRRGSNAKAFSAALLVKN